MPCNNAIPGSLQCPPGSVAPMANLPPQPATAAMDVPPGWQNNPEGYQQYIQQSNQAAALRAQSQQQIDRMNKLPSSTGGHGLSPQQTQANYNARYGNIAPNPTGSSSIITGGLVQQKTPYVMVDQKGNIVDSFEESDFFNTQTGKKFEPTQSRPPATITPTIPDSQPLNQNLPQPPKDLFSAMGDFFKPNPIQTPKTSSGTPYVSGNLGLLSPQPIKENVSRQIATMTPLSPFRTESPISKLYNPISDLSDNLSKAAPYIGLGFITGFKSTPSGKFMVDTITPPLNAAYNQATKPLEYSNLVDQINSKGKQFDETYKPFISDKGFIGTEQQFSQYKSDYGNIESLITKADKVHSEIPSVQLEQMLNKNNVGGIQGNNKPVAWDAMQGVEEFNKNTTDWFTKTIPYAGSTIGAFSGGVIGVTAGLVTQVPVGIEMAGREVATDPLKFPTMFGLHVAHGAAIMAEGIYLGYQTKPIETTASLFGAYYGPHMVYRGGQLINEGSPLKISRFDVPTSKKWDPELNDYTYNHSHYLGVTLDKDPWVRLPGSQVAVGSPYGGKSALLGIRTGDAGLGIAFGKEAPAKLFGNNARPVEAEYNLVDTHTIKNPYNVPIALKAFEPISKPEAIQTVQAIMDIRDVVSNRNFKPEVRVPFGANKPKTLSDEAWKSVIEYVNANAKDFNIYGSTVGASYLSTGGRKTLGDFDALIDTPTGRTHAEALFRIVVEKDFPNTTVEKVPLKTKTGEPDYKLVAMENQKPIIEMKVEKSVLTGTRFSGRMVADANGLTKGELVLDMHPHHLGSGGEWTSIPGSQARTMGYSSLVWGKGTMGYGKLLVPEKGQATIGFDRIKDVVDLSLFSRDAASRLYEPIAVGRYDTTKTKLGIKAEGAALIFKRDVFNLDSNGEGATLYNESKSPLLTPEGKANRSGAILDYYNSLNRRYSRPLGDSTASLFPGVKEEVRVPDNLLESDLNLPRGKNNKINYSFDESSPKDYNVKFSEFTPGRNSKYQVPGFNIGSIFRPSNYQRPGRISEYSIPGNYSKPGSSFKGYPESIYKPSNYREPDSRLVDYNISSRPSEYKFSDYSSKSYGPTQYGSSQYGFEKPYGSPPYKVETPRTPNYNIPNYGERPYTVPNTRITTYGGTTPYKQSSIPKSTYGVSKTQVPPYGIPPVTKPPYGSPPPFSPPPFNPPPEIPPFETPIPWPIPKKRRAIKKNKEETFELHHRTRKHYYPFGEIAPVGSSKMFVLNDPYHIKARDLNIRIKVI